MLNLFHNLGDIMKVESVEAFLARGGEVMKSDTETSLDQLLYNEGLLNHKDAEAVKANLTDAVSSILEKEFKLKE
jgi:hypothetical protein